ncbi:unnamed protein product [Allacma fusca]|uniref:Uncharacterized protein n=1 Tax=Allacma fusca TaxID=39272 RepID=A0A8J2NYI8_9HEXA|nr:unnamed protein product [Allacma fusca]
MKTFLRNCSTLKTSFNIKSRGNEASSSSIGPPGGKCLRAHSDYNPVGFKHPSDLKIVPLKGKSMEIMKEVLKPDLDLIWYENISPTTSPEPATEPFDVDVAINEWINQNLGIEKAADEVNLQDLLNNDIFKFIAEVVEPGWLPNRLFTSRETGLFNKRSGKQVVELTTSPTRPVFRAYKNIRNVYILDTSDRQAGLESDQVIFRELPNSLKRQECTSADIELLRTRLKSKLSEEQRL